MSATRPQHSALQRRARSTLSWETKCRSCCQRPVRPKSSVKFLHRFVTSLCLSAFNKLRSCSGASCRVSAQFGWSPSCRAAEEAVPFSSCCCCLGSGVSLVTSNSAPPAVAKARALLPGSTNWILDFQCAELPHWRCSLLKLKRDREEWGGNRGVNLLHYKCVWVKELVATN